jgi:hypothetical protein
VSGDALTADQIEAARTGRAVRSFASNRSTFAPWTAARIAAMVQSINDSWDATDREAALLPPARLHDFYRGHNGVPRQITLDHPWYFEVRAGEVYVVNAHTLQSCHVRPVGVLRAVHRLAS